MIDLVSWFAAVIGAGMVMRFVVVGFASAFWQIDELIHSI